MRCNECFGELGEFDYVLQVYRKNLDTGEQEPAGWVHMTHLQSRCGSW